MDDIQFWIYIIFAIIYFVGKNFKKKAQEQQKPRPRPNSPSEPQGDYPQRPVTFEDLLEEITGRRSAQPAPSRQREDIPAVPAREVKMKADIEIEEEGNRRAFADEESKRVYEESIKKAEGFELAYQQDEHYQTRKLFNDRPDRTTENEFASEIKSMLKNGDSARKAVILSEILQRKY